MSGASHPPGHGPVLTKIGHGLAKVFGVKLNYRENPDPVTRGESAFSVSTADTYVEEEPTSVEWLQEVTPGVRDMGRYFYSLVPFIHWLPHYNFTWALGDLVAGITVGAVVVPQSMAYAQLATLSPEFGLYSSFMGVMIYWFFATSKDITIGPVAVLSTVTGNVLLEAAKKVPHVPNYIVAADLAIVAGGIVAAIGFLRLGWIVDFISLTSVSAFITGSAFSIAVQQVPTLLGIPKTVVNNRRAAYHVAVDTLKHLGHTRLDAALGLTALLMLYIFKFGFQYLSKRFPRKAKLFFFLATLRTAFVILLYTLISWLGTRHTPKLHQGKNYQKARWAILGTVPRGFQHTGAPPINREIVGSFVNQLPATVIVLLIEHISIAKSFGRVNNYTINPSQELVAIGVTNLLGSFLSAYPATGSFSRTAIKSKAGVRTPLAGVITGIVVLLAIYALTAVFFYIPNAGLAAVIIHAVLDLITPMNTLYQFWRISPLEVLIFLAGVFVTVFSSIENGIYTTVAVSAALLLWRVAKAKGHFLGRVTVHSVVGDHVLDGTPKNGSVADNGFYGKTDKSDSNARDVFLPIDHKDGSNPLIALEQPYPGVFIYRFSEGFNYPNAGHYLDYMVQEVQRQTRRTDPNLYSKKGDRPWNDPAPKKDDLLSANELSKPTFKAIIIDFASVNNVDITSVQYLVDVRNQLDRWASPDRPEWHIASINNRWTKRALVSAGFGYSAQSSEVGEFHRWKPVFSVAEIGGADSAAAQAEARDNARARKSIQDIESRQVEGDRIEAEYMGQTKIGLASKVAVVQGLNRPFFHIDLSSALVSAIKSAKAKEDFDPISAEAKRDDYGSDSTDSK